MNVYAAGSAEAVGLLNANPALLPVLNDVAQKIPLINTGKLTPSDFGALSGELTQLRLKTIDLTKVDPANSEKYAQADAFLSSIISSNAALSGGRAPTASNALATVTLTQFSNGLTDGVLFWQGRQSVVNPGK